MFVRFRETARRLQASLIETRRADGRVRHRHVASLGSIAHQPTVTDRLGFWTALHQRLARLSNQVDGRTYGAILAAVHARIPMPTQDEQCEAALECARSDARFWEGIGGAQAGTAKEMQEIADTTARTAAKNEKAAADAAAKAKAAQERAERIERGEEIGTISKPLTRAEFIAASGMTHQQVRQCELIAEIGEMGGFEMVVAEILKRKERAERAAVRSTHELLTAVRAAHGEDACTRIAALATSRKLC
jgi:hypothetical protein